MAVQVIAAAAGTVAFAVLFSTPARYYVWCGIVGALGWLAYSLLLSCCSEPVACTLATMLVILLSRIAAVWKHCPATIFLIAGLFPLVPGAGIYWTVYFFVTGEPALALQNGYPALQNALAIVLGIILIFEIPQSFFLRVFGRKGPPG